MVNGYTDVLPWKLKYINLLVFEGLDLAVGKLLTTISLQTFYTNALFT